MQRQIANLALRQLTDQANKRSELMAVTLQPPGVEPPAKRLCQRLARVIVADGLLPAGVGLAQVMSARGQFKRLLQWRIQVQGLRYATSKPLHLLAVIGNRHPWLIGLGLRTLHFPEEE